MKIALAQVNTMIGDLSGNVDRCLGAIQAAASQGAELVVLPELAVPGYSPRDILFDSSFVEAVQEANLDLAERAKSGPPAIVGSLAAAGRRSAWHPGLYNVALLLDGGDTRMAAVKQILPGYDVYFEPRWFLPGPPSQPITLSGRKIGILVCADMWDEGSDGHPPTQLQAAGAEILICINASPYRVGIVPRRLEHARRPGCPLVYVNLVGANDELVFDGRSFVLDAHGQPLCWMSSFQEEVRLVDLDQAVPASLPEEDPQADLFQALVLGVRDFAAKNRLQQAFLGLSGGIDSALVACVAAEALGPERVTALAIPSRYTDPKSTECARELARTLGIRLEVVDLEPLHASAEAVLGDLLAEGTTAENVQARLRAMILMAFVNSQGGMLLNTSNKTELALGYATLYGDMAGSLSPLGDLTKLQVIELAGWVDANRTKIPDFVLERPPSAELRAGQVDPFDYAEVVPVMENLVQANRSNPAMRRSEHKRWQMGIILKVSEKSFGSGRMIPVTRK